jgi:hypothetical protein
MYPKNCSNDRHVENDVQAIVTVWTFEHRYVHKTKINILTTEINGDTYGRPPYHQSVGSGEAIVGFLYVHTHL